MVAEPGRPGTDMVMAQSFQMIGEVTAGTSSEEETLKRTMFENAACDQCGAQRVITGVEQKEKLEDEKQLGSKYKVEDCVAARVTEDWSQEQRCNGPSCWSSMKATYLDDEQWYRVYDETSLEDSLAFLDSDSVQRPDMLEWNIIELVDETHTLAVTEGDDNRDLHGNRVITRIAAGLLVSSLRQWTKRRSARVLAVMSRRARH